jgi:uncharacterized glyoxalase superfamily protein PhnB
MRASFTRGFLKEDAMSGSMVIPSFRYKDAHAAMDWLETVLGFVRQAVYEGPDGTVAHAQMTFGETGMIMLGAASNENPMAKLVAKPEEIGMRVTSPIYLMVSDCLPVWEKVLAAGANVSQELKTMDYGGSAFSVVDPEGYVWSVGEYDPWV